MAKHVVVFVTVDKQKTADIIIKKVISSRLAACVNEIKGVRSTYWWKGKVEKAGEILLVMKTKTSLMDKLIKTVKSLHPYEVPEIIALPIVKGGADYMKWIGKETI
ncbi:MAG: divalent-cation tolerance protein CutA [Spirochaetia bacterium]|nr:divalent-cation tolerance protein CutA [Spirochaetia bacterium]